MNLNYQSIAKSLSRLGLFMVATVMSLQVNAQAINETFNNIPGLFTSGWAQQNLSTPAGSNPTWGQGAVSVFPAFSNPDSSYIAVNYNSVAGTGTISNWLFVPNRTFNNGDIITFYTRTPSTAYPDRLQVRLSLNGTSVNVGTTNTSVGDFTTLLLDINPTLGTAYPTVWTQYSITISGLAGPTSGRVAFRYFVTNGGPTGTNSNYIGIDDFVYTPVGGGTPDVAVVSSKPGEYTLVPLAQAGAPIPVNVRLSNIGTSNAASVNVATRIFLAPNFTTPVQTLAGSTTNLANGASTTVNMGSFSPVAGAYLYEHIISGNTGAAGNDTLRHNVTYTNNVYARDNSTSVQGVGAGNTLSVIIGNNYRINANTIMDSVTFFCYPGAAGLNDTIRVRIASCAASAYATGQPSNATYLGQSAIYRFTVADTGGRVITLPVTNMTGGTLNLTPGTVNVGIEKYLTSDNYGLQCTASIFTDSTVWANINNGAYSPLNVLLAGFNFTPIIRPYLRSACPAISGTPNVTNATCTASNGSAVVAGSGGVAPYTYMWSNGATSGTANGLAAGAYTVTVTDNNGCPGVVSVTVGTNNTTVTASNSTNQAGCGLADGDATVTPTNGTGPYTYMWSNGQNTATATGLAANTYAVTITDANGCRGIISGIAVTNPNAPTASSSATGALCNGGSTGSATVTPTGGTAPYTYMWSNGATTASATGLAAGSYNVTVIDDNNCAVTSAATVTQPTAVAATTNAAATANVSCKSGSNGMAGVTVTGGTGAYTYMWSNSATTASIVGLTAGTYMVTVMDANSCAASHSITVTEPATALNASVAGTNVNCNGGTSGTATVTGTGGTGAYTFMWSNGQTSATAVGLAAGTYMATVVDANGCSAVSSAVTVTEPTALANSGVATAATSAGGSDGSVTLTATGGTAPYGYLWSNGATTQNLAAVVAGTYTVTITDANGCTSNGSFTVLDGPIAVLNTNGNIQVSVFPNPASEKATLSLQLANSSDVTIQVTDVTGRVLTSINDANVVNNQYSLEMSEWAAGVYFVRVTAGSDTATYRLTVK